MTLETEQTSFSHKPLKEEIFDQLHGNIIAGKYTPGDWLRQEEIANQMGVSMTPVREALDLLVAAGLAEKVPYRGVRVREMSVEEVVEAYGLRLVLEAMIAQEAATKITEEQLSHMENMLAEMRRHESLNQVSTARRLSRDFHSAIADASGNGLLGKVYAIVANAFPDWLLYEALYRQPELLTDSMSNTDHEHTAIVDALKDRDANRAVEASLEHVMESGKWLVEYLGIPEQLLVEKEAQVPFLIKKSLK